MEKIKINSTNGYLNLSDLPYNCIFNKKITGAGGTTITLFNNENYVICVPTTELITNKTGLINAGASEITNYDGKKQLVFGLFGVFSYTAKKDLESYVSSEGIKKIMCTYDKLPYLSKYINTKDYRLLVDEYHILLKAYAYRDNAINGVFDNFRSYKSFCFMSATPISPEFTPSRLNDISIIEAEWNNVDTLKVKLDQTNKPYIKAANYINSYKTKGYIELNGKKSYEAFFFVNSVNDIASILKYSKLSNDEVKIVCADNELNRKKLEGYTISNSRSENKKFTFITSKSFEGADYYSDSAITFVLSNSRNKNTLLDISTDIYQIAGRIRTENNPFRNTLIHIFNTVGKRSLNLDITYEEMVDKVDKNIKGANEIINLINNASDNAKDMAIKMLNSEYVVITDNGYTLNDMIVKLDLYTYKLEQTIYNTGISIRKEYKDNGVNVTYSYDKIEDKEISNINKKLGFKEAFIKYCELKNNNGSSVDLDIIAAQQPLVVEAYKLGESEVKALDYSKRLIENELISRTCFNADTKVAKMITDHIKLGFISSKQAKGIIADAYNTMGLKATAKASDLDKWFECKSVTKKIDGVVVKGYEIYSRKFIF